MCEPYDKRQVSGRGGPSSAPGLELDHVALGIGDVAPGDAAAGGGDEGPDLVDRLASSRQHGFARGRHVVDLERDVAEAEPIGQAPGARLGLAVLVDLEQILVINDRLAKLIETRASLLTRLPPPESFMAFLDHQRALESLWDMGQDAQAESREPSFPRDLDKDIKEAIDSIQSRLRALGDD
jgi:hypothetical protein